MLDVAFDEDQCRARKDHAAQNLATLRKVCLALHEQETSIKDILRGKRYRAALDENILENILFPKDSKSCSPYTVLPSPIFSLSDESPYYTLASGWA